MTSRRLWAVLGVLFGCCWMASASALAQDEIDLESPAEQAVEAAPTFPATEGEAQSPAGSASRRASAIWQVWQAEGISLEDRVSRTRRAALEEGVWNLDSAARALIAEPTLGADLERAKAAVALAPDLPMARMALARALWFTGESPIAALRAAGQALLAVPRHFDASLWFAGSSLYMVAIGVFVGALLCLAVTAAAVSPHAAHDLGDLIAREMPAYARAALLAALLLVPLSLGQGWLGIGVGFLGLGMAYGDHRQRAVLALAAVVLVAAVHPVARWAGAALTAYSEDPVLASAVSATDGFATPVDRARLEAVSEIDPIAEQALGAIARREGSLGAADAIYQRLLEDRDPVQSLLNNAGSVRLALGHLESSMGHYRDAASLGASPAVLFNLSRVYGRAFQVEELNRTLAAAQVAGGDVVAELTHLQGSEQRDFTVDLPLDRGELWTRVFAEPAGEAFASELRNTLAPGVLGSDWRYAGTGMAVVALLASGAGIWGRRSHWCARCGRRLCPRCDPEFGGGEICGGCTRLFHQPETTDRALRLVRIEALRRRDERIGRLRMIASIVVPGSAGVLAQRPITSLVGAMAAGLGTAAVVWIGGVVPDPLVLGSAAPLGFGLLAGFAAFAYMMAVTTALASKGS